MNPDRIPQKARLPLREILLIAFELETTIAPVVIIPFSRQFENERRRSGR
jgi:hypothetical protein